VIDLSPFTKHEVSGPGSEAWLDSLVANKVPTKIGRIALCHALTRRGGIRSEFTITKLGEERFYVVSAGAAERYDSDYLQQLLPAVGGGVNITLRNITTSRGCFVLAGPRSREVLAKLTDAPLDNAAFPWLTGQVAEVGLATDVYLLRVNFVGALGWELHFPIEYAHHLFDAMFAAGAEFGIGMAGMRAMESLRMEKSYRMWGTDLTPDYTPYEAGLDRFVRLNKGAFIGKERSRSSSRRESRTASSRSKCTVSSMPIRSATSRCTTFRASSSAARPRATTATRSARASRSATSIRLLRAKAPN
jgi:dimethylglycine dehydrogenase